MQKLHYKMLVIQKQKVKKGINKLQNKLMTLRKLMKTSLENEASQQIDKLYSDIEEHTVLVNDVKRLQKKSQNSDSPVDYNNLTKSLTTHINRMKMKFDYIITLTTKEMNMTMKNLINPDSISNSQESLSDTIPTMMETTTQTTTTQENTTSTQTDVIEKSTTFSQTEEIECKLSVCDICNEEKTEFLWSPNCVHSFCKECVVMNRRTNGRRCMMCRVDTGNVLMSLTINSDGVKFSHINFNDVPIENVEAEEEFIENLDIYSRSTSPASDNDEDYIPSTAELNSIASPTNDNDEDYRPNTPTHWVRVGTRANNRARWIDIANTTNNNDGDNDDDDDELLSIIELSRIER
uniref:Bre1 protein n=1 Tax=Fopius arisanus TaxID=64838 RepID=A0A0C9R6M1_9HYME